MNEMKDVLIVNENLLPWYDESTDTIETDQKGFPQDVLDQIVAFGECRLEYIDEEEAHFVRLGK